MESGDRGDLRYAGRLLHLVSLLRGNRYLGGRLNRRQQEQASIRTAVLKAQPAKAISGPR